MLDDYAQILVTGGSGFIGRNLVKELLTLGKRVIVVDKDRSFSGYLRSPQMTYLHADIRNKEQAADLMQGVDLVFHIAGNADASISIQDPLFDFETNALGTFTIVDAAHKAGVKKLIYASSALIYGPTQHLPLREFYPPQPLVPYAASKLAGEISCLSFFHAYHFPITIARLFCVYGPDEDPRRSRVEVSRYLRWHLNHQPIRTIGDIDLKTRDYIHVSDVVRGLLLLAEKGNKGEIFNIGSGQEVSMRQLIDTISLVTGREAIVSSDTSTMADSYRQVADISRMRELGYEPHISLKEGIMGLLEAFGERPELPDEEMLLARQGN